MLRQRVHGLLDVFCYVQGIGVRLQENADEYSRYAILEHVDAVVGAAKLDAGDVAQSHHLSFGSCSNDHVLVLRDVGEPALDARRILHLLSRRNRGNPDAAGGCDDVLLLDDSLNIVGGHPKPRHFVWVEPDAHAVISRPEQPREANSRDT